MDGRRHQTQTPAAATLERLARDDRPREKLLRAGAAALGDNELVAVLLGSGLRSCDVLGVAAAVLDAAGDACGLSRITAEGLMRTPGVGPTRAARLLAAVELGRRALAAPRLTRPRLGSAAAVGAYLLPRHGGHREERFGVLLLDTKHRVIRAVVVSLGTLDASLVHPREVFRTAAEHSAASVVLFHNHPSGDPTPSAEDVWLTRRLAQAGDLMGIAVVDHVVLGDGCWHSVRESSPGVFGR
jgi:DNA repair protein RadC